MKLEKLLSQPDILPKLAKNTEQPIKALFRKLKSKKPGNLDAFVHQKHELYFAQVDCLDCGNCCKSLGPRLRMPDIERLAKFLKIKTKDFIEQYLRIDEDQDFVFKTMPCPFLDDDNYCFVYENRPKACREYPHTDRKKFYQVLPETLQNRSTCAVVYQICEDIKDKYSSKK